MTRLTIIMKKYNFDEIVPRKGTNCLKYDAIERFFKSDDLLPLWVADMDFKTPDFIVNAIKERVDHEIYGYTFRSDSYYDAVINWMKRRHNWEIQRDWIVMCPGVVPSLNAAVRSPVMLPEKSSIACSAWSTIPGRSIIATRLCT